MDDCQSRANGDPRQLSFSPHHPNNIASTLPSVIYYSKFFNSSTFCQAMDSISPLHMPGTYPKSPASSERNVDSYTSSSCIQDDEDNFHEKNLLLKEELEKGNLPIKPFPCKKTMKYYFRKLFPIVMSLVFVACLFGIKMMPAKYMVLSLLTSSHTPRAHLQIVLFIVVKPKLALLFLPTHSRTLHCMTRKISTNILHV
jgi:hypothetical protein